MAKTLGEDTVLDGPMTNLSFLHAVVVSERE